MNTLKRWNILPKNEGDNWIESEHPEGGWVDAEEALARIRELEATNRAQAQRVETLKKALEKIERWEMPHTGYFHDDGTEKSYGWCYGSNGERDYIRDVARAALKREAEEGE